jgi:hypothetical protein
MTPRWLTDLVRLYAICVGSLTLFYFGFILYGLDARNRLHGTVILGRGLDIITFGLFCLFLIGGVLMCCFYREGKAPVLLTRCWKLVSLLILSLIFTVAVIA